MSCLPLNGRLPRKSSPRGAPLLPGLRELLMGNPISEREFLRRAYRRFGDRYDYSLMIYKSYKTPVVLKCRKHPVKDVVITPERHLQTTGGCKFCLREMRVRSLERELSRPAAEGSPFMSMHAFEELSMRRSH